MSIQRGGRLSWNYGFYEALGRPEYVRLLLDTEAGLLGVRASPPGTQALRVRKSTRQRTWAVSAKAALRHGAPALLVDRAYPAPARDVGEGIMAISVAPLLNGTREPAPPRDAEGNGKR